MSIYDAYSFMLMLNLFKINYLRVNLMDKVVDSFLIEIQKSGWKAMTETKQGRPIFAGKKKKKDPPIQRGVIYQKEKVICWDKWVWLDCRWVKDADHGWNMSRPFNSWRKVYEAINI